MFCQYANGEELVFMSCSFITLAYFSLFETVWFTPQNGMLFLCEELNAFPPPVIMVSIDSSI